MVDVVRSDKRGSFYCQIILKHESLSLSVMLESRAKWLEASHSDLEVILGTASRPLLDAVV